MTQKQSLMRALEFAESPFRGEERRAARAWFTVSWLHDMNWHPEADALEEKARGVFASGFKRLDTDAAAAGRLDLVASFLNCLHGWGLRRDEWREVKGQALTDELWKIVRAPAEFSS